LPDDGTTTPPVETPVTPVTPPAEGGDETPTEGTPAVPSLPGAHSSKFFLQAGAFNLNSTNPAAWRAVLRSVRFPAPRAFTYLNAAADTGTAGDDALATLSSSDARFFRFPQTAQETFKTEAPVAVAEGETPTVVASTDLFRQGMKTLDGPMVAALAEKITALITIKQRAENPLGGPFRTVEEFISPSPLFASVDAEGIVGAPRSLLEAAIADAETSTGQKINTTTSGPIKFSSQYLTQADVMTALAPILFARSDTFLIRTYGEALNPTTTAVEGRAWCEALVQRTPEFFSDPANNPPDVAISAFDAPSNVDDPASAPTPEHTLNKIYGRRFKVISFRWLTRSDI
jgi:hypothetical protein